MLVREAGRNVPRIPDGDDDRPRRGWLWSVQGANSSADDLLTRWTQRHGSMAFATGSNGNGNGNGNGHAPATNGDAMATNGNGRSANGHVSTNGHAATNGHAVNGHRQLVARATVVDREPCGEDPALLLLEPDQATDASEVVPAPPWQGEDADYWFDAYTRDEPAPPTQAPPGVPPPIWLEERTFIAAQEAPAPRRSLAVPHWVSAVTRRSMRRALVLLALAPLTVLLSTRLAHLTIDPILGLYAVLTLCTTGVVMFLAFARYQDPSLRAPAQVQQPLVSCMIAVKNEIDVISRCLLSVLDSSYANIELIVVDDGSTDGTADRLAAMQGQYPSLEVIYLSESVGKKRALTVAAARARGDYFVFTDSDCVLGRDAIERLMMAFAADGNIGAVSGHARALNGSRNFLTKVQDTWYEGQFSVWKAAESVFGAVTCVSGPLAGFRREAIYNFLPAWAEDSFLGKEFRFATDRQLTGYVLGARRMGARLKQRHADSSFVRNEDHPLRDWRIEYVKSARVWTLVPFTMRRLLIQQVRWKKSFIRNLFFTGSFYWREGLFPALMFYSHVLFVLAMPLMAFRHLVWLPLHGAWVLSALYLCGIFFKGSVWALAYKWENPRCHRWIYRPFMSLLTAVFFSTLLVYSTITLRRNVWVR